MAEIRPLRCRDCGHTWIPRKEKPPKKCPRCQHFNSIEVVGGVQKNPEAKTMLDSASAEEVKLLRGVLAILRADDPIYAPAIYRAVERFQAESKRSQAERPSQKKAGGR
jgi:phage FluMu protein Com